MSGTVLETAIVLVVLTLCVMHVIVVALLRHRGNGVNLPGYLALLVPGRSGEGHTTWEPFVIDAGTHDHDDRYATPGNITDAMADHVADNNDAHDNRYSQLDHRHDGVYSPAGHAHDQYVTYGALTRRLAALRISQIPQNLRGALAIILASSLIGALVGLVLDLTVLRNMYHHQMLNSVTGKVVGTTVNLTPHYHMVVDWLQALGAITMCTMAGGLLGIILVLLTWWHRDRDVQVVLDEN